jgi:hypothetical protein
MQCTELKELYTDGCNGLSRYELSYLSYELSSCSSIPSFWYDKYIKLYKNKNIMYFHLECSFCDGNDYDGNGNNDWW